MSYIKNNFLLKNKTAEELYFGYAKDMKIFDYHCHLPEKQILENKSFNDIYEIWLAGDHYKWRLMRNYGADEEYITGSKSNREKFLTYCRVLGTAFGNPLYHWSQVELKEYFGCELEINEKNAEAIWDMCNDYIRKNKITVLESEYMVNNDLVAGTIDLVLMDDKQFIIADIKTTSSLHKDSVSWQLSIYTYLYWLDRVGEENLLENYNNTLGQAYHFGKSGLKVVDIHLRPLEEVLRLIECERQGIPYTQPNIIPVDQLVLLEDAELEVARLEALVKAASQKRDEFRQGILKAMEENGIINYESDLLKISYIAPSVRTTIDSAKLKKDLPDLAKEYSKEVKSNASVRITIKGENNE